MPATIHAHPIFLDFIIITNVFRITSACSVLQLLVVSSSLGPDIPFNTMFFPRCEGELLHSCKTTLNILLLSDLIFTFLEIRRELLYVTCGNEPSAFIKSGAFVE
jgi:hypothetical protein